MYAPYVLSVHVLVVCGTLGCVPGHHVKSKTKGRVSASFFHELYKETRFHCVHLFSQEPFKNVSIGVKVSAARFRGSVKNEEDLVFGEYR